MNMRISGAALALAAVAIFAAACGSSDSKTPAAQAGPSGATDYASCLRNNGVDLPQLAASRLPSGRGSARPSGFPTARPSGQPRPSGSADFPGRRGGGGGFFGSVAPSGVNQQTWDKARQACASLLPTAFPGGGNGNGGGGRDTAFRNCLTEHGVTDTAPINQLNTADPKIAAAMQVCAVLRPSANPS